MASELKVNTLTGVSTAGSIAVTGEGNSTTTNLQQGLAKTWSYFDDGQNLLDSFNVSTLTDINTAKYSTTNTNNFSSVNYCWYGVSGIEGGIGYNAISPTASNTTSTISMITWVYNGASVDRDFNTICAMGDLA